MRTFFVYMLRLVSQICLEMLGPSSIYQIPDLCPKPWPFPESTTEPVGFLSGVMSHPALIQAIPLRLNIGILHGIFFT